MLKKSLPQALTVHGAVLNINRGNPLGYEIVADSWPDFKAIIARPCKEVASDDLDMYANAYAGFYHNLDVYRDLVLDRNAVNWTQSCRIQGSQDGIYEVSREAAAIKRVPFSPTSFITYLHPNPNQMPEYRVDPGFVLSTMNSSQVDLLNETWPYGGNERSRRYLANILQNFPTMCLLDAQGQPVSWSIMDTFGAHGHSYTLPSFRGKGYSTVVRKALAIKTHAAGYPAYGHVAHDNLLMQKLQERACWSLRIKRGLSSYAGSVLFFQAAASGGDAKEEPPSGTCAPSLISDSWQVHGAVLNINRGNPLGYEIVVDSWPDFKAILARPRKEVASDDLDIFANAYAGFYHDLDVYRDLVLDRNAVNWTQSCRIQGNQDGIYEVSREAAAIKRVPFSPTSFITYLHPDPKKMPEYRVDPGFMLSTLNSSHVDLLNETWPYGGTKQSRRYLANMVRCFPTTCLLDVQGQPVSWSIMDTFGALGHGYTLPSFRGKGYSTVVAKALAIKTHAAGYPTYGHVAHDNLIMQKLILRMGYQKLPDLFQVCIHSEV
ncbi:hypothetical protein JRQ81_000095 [Phrynocephalus forsythii]|uniref:Glycine N-acyltransferase-like protein n=1 Tax=Phrynocephalus forsythii TaxID=171643 RepID=A0A9Q1B7K2_9SAUR|nr:hypothetical protein JRQ81_000095 [Phrynocephalus forsythii]